MDIRVNQGSQRDRTFQAGIQRDTHFPQERQVWPKASGGNDFLDGTNPFLLARNHDPLLRPVESLDMDIGDQVDLSTLDQVLNAPAKLSTCGQGIALPTAKELVNPLPANGPHDLG
jgi:hypothetical protein